MMVEVEEYRTFKERRCKLINTKKLNDRIESSGMKKSYIADEMGISRQALWGKMTNKVKFTPDEQQYLVEKLDIRTMKEFRDIFFSNDVEEK